MAQRDNALNKKTTEASLEVSRFSKLDSKDMRTIAAVTLAFLPATFMAVCSSLPCPLTFASFPLYIANKSKTFFSTEFFDFHKDGQVVSPYIWLYWLFTVLLTIFVYFGWYWYSRRNRRASNPEKMF